MLAHLLQVSENGLKAYVIWLTMAPEFVAQIVRCVTLSPVADMDDAQALIVIAHEQFISAPIRRPWQRKVEV